MRNKDEEIEAKLKQWNKEWDEEGLFPQWAPGTHLKVVYEQGCSLKKGEIVVALDMDRFPTKKKEFAKRYGEDKLAFAVCVQRMDRDVVEFYIRPRFRLSGGVATA